MAAILELGLVIGFGAISNRVKISVADKMGHLIMEGSRRRREIKSRIVPGNLRNCLVL